MGCQYCGNEILPIRRLQDADFCSPAHRQLYYDRLRGALNRLTEPEPPPSRASALLYDMVPADCGRKLTDGGLVLRSDAPPPCLPTVGPLAIRVLVHATFAPSQEPVPHAPPPVYPRKVRAKGSFITPDSLQSLNAPLAEIHAGPGFATARAIGPKAVSGRPPEIAATAVFAFRPPRLVLGGVPDVLPAWAGAGGAVTTLQPPVSVRCAADAHTAAAAVPACETFFRPRVEAAHPPAMVRALPAVATRGCVGAIRLPALPAVVAADHAPGLSRRSMPAAPEDKLPLEVPGQCTPKRYSTAFAMYRMQTAAPAAGRPSPANPVPVGPSPAELPGLPPELGLAKVSSPMPRGVPGMATFASQAPAAVPGAARERSFKPVLWSGPGRTTLPQDPGGHGIPIMTATGQPARLALFWRNAPTELARHDGFLAAELDFHLPRFTVLPVLEALQVPVTAETPNRRAWVAKMARRNAVKWRRRNVLIQKGLAIAASILAAVALWSGGGAAAVGRAMGSQRWIRQVVASRASVEHNENFKGGMKAWTGAGEGWARTWAYDQEGYIRPGDFALYRPSMAHPDYRLEMLAQIERNSLAWGVRAHDRSNYYAVKLSITKPGPRPLVSLVRYAVMGGRHRESVSVPVRVTLQKDTPYHVVMDVNGRNYSASIDGQQVDTWTDDTHTSGGIALFSDAGDRARLYWVKVTSNDDLLGRFCSMLAGDAPDDRDSACNAPKPRRMPARFSLVPATIVGPGWGD
ncbi:MAG TPA: hypothetical protein VN442_18590 [Bryobacteraceae bacterium]|nr:hypothetical protein [Bryobacteraceae bacterium]